jgi:hypothetical protein
MAGAEFRTTIEVKDGGPDLSKVKMWDAEAMAGLCAWSVETHVERTTQHGVGADGQRFKAYSATPIALDFRHPTALRLEPKGGEPMYGHPDDKVIGNPMRAFVWSQGPEDAKRARALYRKTKGRRGRSDWVVIGRRYPGGYAEYKRASRKGSIASAEVDLTLSGELMDSVDMIAASATEGLVSIRGQAREYGVHVNAKRQFLGHHQGEIADMDAEIGGLVDEATERKQARGAAPSPDPVL